MNNIDSCADPWIMSSLLQKAIRRGDQGVASRAASRLLHLRGNALWRRLVVIAFEDVGVASPLILYQVCRACDSAWRFSQGSDEVVADQLVRTLAASNKSRTAEQVWTTACYSPITGELRKVASRRDQEAGRAALKRADLPLIDRAVQIAVSPAMALKAVSEWLPCLFATCTSPDWRLILQASVSAAKITREPFVLLVPLICIESTDVASYLINEELPQVRCSGDLPLYALDKHTRLGRTAIRRFAAENVDVRDILSAVPKETRLQAAYMAAFYADAASLDSRLMLPATAHFEGLARAADLLRTGVPEARQQTLQAAFERNLAHLNDVRMEVYERARRGSVEENGQCL